MAKNDVDWELAKDFCHDDTGIVVRVNKLPLFYPQYSVEIGVKSKTYDTNGYLLRHVKASNLSEHDLGDVVGELTRAAQGYIQEQVAGRHEEIAKLEAEKAQKEKDKRERHRQNQEARKEENRQRSKGVGKVKA